MLYGPGDLRLAQGPREAVAVAELIAATPALALLALSTAGTR